MGYDNTNGHHLIVLLKRRREQTEFLIRGYRFIGTADPISANRECRRTTNPGTRRCSHCQWPSLENGRCDCHRISRRHFLAGPLERFVDLRRSMFWKHRRGGVGVAGIKYFGGAGFLHQSLGRAANRRTFFIPICFGGFQNVR